MNNQDGNKLATSIQIHHCVLPWFVYVFGWLALLIVGLERLFCMQATNDEQHENSRDSENETIGETMSKSHLRTSLTCSLYFLPVKVKVKVKVAWSSLCSLINNACSIYLSRVLILYTHQSWHKQTQM